MPGPQGFSQADRLELVRRYSVDEFSAGKDVLVQFGNLPQLDSQGRRKFLVGFLIKARVEAQSPVNGGGSIQWKDTLGYFRNFRMRALGIPLFEGDVDARHLQDDVRYRLAERAPCFVVGRSEYDVVDDAAPEEVELEIFYPFGDPWNRKSSRKNDCAIPLSALDHRRDATSVLEFRMGPLPYNANNSSVTCRVVDLEVYALTRAELEPIVGALPRLIEVRQTQLHEAMERSSIDRDARLEYAVIRHRPEDSLGGDVDIAPYTGLTVRHGQDQWLTAADARQANLAFRTLYDPMVYSHMALGGTPPLMMLMAETLPIVATVPGSDISEGAAYPVYWDIQSRGDYAFTRTLRRERITLRSVERAAMAVLQGVPRDRAVPEVKVERFAASTITSDFVPQRIKLAPPAAPPARRPRLRR